MPTRWHTKGKANNSTFRNACGLSILAWQNWADNGYTHEECSRTCFARSECENLPDCAVDVLEGTAWWEGWCGRGHQKEDYEHWWLQYIDILRVWELPCTKGAYRQLPWFLCVCGIRSYFNYWKNKWVTSLFDKWGSSSSIEILIRIALWWSGLSPLIFSTKRRRVSRVMLEGRNEQTRGRQIKRRGKQRERLKPGLTFIRIDNFIDCCVLLIRIDYGFHSRHLTCCSFADWALLKVKWVDYVVTIRFDSLSGHTWLYCPCRFFCCLECQNVMSIAFFHRCQVPSVQTFFSPGSVFVVSS